MMTVDVLLTRPDLLMPVLYILRGREFHFF